MDLKVLVELLFPLSSQAAKAAATAKLSIENFSGCITGFLFQVISLDAATLGRKLCSSMKLRWHFCELNDCYLFFIKKPYGSTIIVSFRN
jgi:hypothetical protein